MIFPEKSIVVLDIAGARARVHCNDANMESVLVNAGFSKDGTQLVRSIQDDVDRRQLVLFLAKLGGLFSVGKDWSPAELVAYYKQQGMQLDSFSVIAWRTPDDFFVTTQQ